VTPAVARVADGRWYGAVDDGRRRHYGTFYGIDPVPSDRPVLVVHGNCQAESLRVLLTGPSERVDGSSTRGPFATVRIPPVHELTAEDLPFLRDLLTRTAVLLSHPVRPGYRDLPIGTPDCAELMPRESRVLRFPIVRYLGLHPFQAIVRHPRDPSAVPALVPYHDLRVLAAVRDGLSGDAARDRVAGAVAAPEVVRAIGEQSLAELARREQACDVTVSDGIAALLPVAGAALMHTINHPGNEVLIELAHRVQVALGVPPDAADQGRALLGGVRASVTGDVRVAHGFAAGTAEPEHWVLGSRVVSLDDLTVAHLAWYAEYPEFVPAGLERHAERLALLGL